MDADIRRLWPEPDPSPLDDAALLSAYPTPPGPMLRMNFVASLDGAVTIGGYSAGLGSPADKRVFHLLRVACDAVLVGAGTLRNEGYGPVRANDHLRELRVAQGRAPAPVLVVVSRRLDLDPSLRAFTEAPVRPIVLTNHHAPLDRQEALAAVADVLVLGEAEVDFPAALAALAERGHRHVLSEGGPHLLGALTAADVVDELCLTMAPKLAGPGAGRITAGPATPVRDLALRLVLAAGDELLLRYAKAG